METLLKALPAIAELGVIAVFALIMGAVIWWLIQFVKEQKDDFLKQVNSFEDTIKKEGEKNREAQEKDAEKVTAAINHLNDLVKHINKGM